MFNNSTKTVKVPLFTLSNLPTDIQQVAYEEWAARTKDGLANSKDSEYFQEFLDGLCEGFGFVLYDAHSECYYIKEDDGENAISFDEVVKECDQKWSLNSGGIDASFLKYDSKEEITRYLNSLIENESDVGDVDKYTKLWGCFINEKYQEKLKSLDAGAVGTDKHYYTTIEAMQEGFECTFNAFIGDLKALSSKETFEKEADDHAVFLANGSFFDMDADLYYQE